MIKFILGKRAVSPVIGTILMVAVTVIMAAIVGGFVYQTGRPKVAPTIASSLEDDERVVLVAGTMDQRIAKLTFEGGKNIAKAELRVIVTYTDDAEYTAVLDGGSWNAYSAQTAADAVAMGAGYIEVLWVDSDQSQDITPGDRLDFYEGSAVDAAKKEVLAGTDFTVKVIHRPTESVVANHTVKVY